MNNVAQFIHDSNMQVCVQSWTTTAINEPKRAELLCNLISIEATKIEDMVAQLTENDMESLLEQINASKRQSADEEKASSDGGKVKKVKKVERTFTPIIE